MQGAHDWYETLATTYDKLGYITSRADPCVRYKREEEGYTITDTYTDDVFGASETDEEIERRKEEMATENGKLRMWGRTSTFLGRGSNRTSTQELSNSPSDHTGNMSSTVLTWDMFNLETPPSRSELSWIAACLPKPSLNGV